MSSTMDVLDGTSVNWSGKGLDVVPVDDIAKHPQVRELDLSHNNIKILTMDFSLKLPHLAFLDLGRNFLENLPKNFGLLSNLRHLDLRSNKIRSLPISMAGMKQLVWLDMQDNPINGPLAEVVGQFWSAKDCRNAAKSIVAFMSQVQLFIKNKNEYENNNSSQGVECESTNSPASGNEILDNMVQSNEIPTGEESFNFRFMKNIVGEEPQYRRKKEGVSVVFEWVLRIVLWAITGCGLLLVLLALLYSPVKLREQFNVLPTGLSPLELFHIIPFCHETLQNYIRILNPVFPLVKEPFVEKVSRSWYSFF